MIRLAHAFARAAYDVAFIGLLFIIGAAITAVPVMIWRAIAGALS